MKNLLAHCQRGAGVLLLAALPALAQNNAAQTPAPVKAPTRLTIHAGRLLDVRTGEYRSNVYIVVEDNRIAAVGDFALTNAPVIDLSSQTVMPGLTDCHAHILGNLKDQSATAPLRVSSPMAALWGYRNLQVWLDRLRGQSHQRHGRARRRRCAGARPGAAASPKSGRHGG
jgi:hypothetical protein